MTAVSSDADAVMVAMSLEPVMLTTMSCVAVPSDDAHGERVGDVLAGGQRIRLGLVERVGPRPGGRVEGEGAVVAGERGRGG